MWSGELFRAHKTCSHTRPSLDLTEAQVQAEVTSITQGALVRTLNAGRLSDMPWTTASKKESQDSNSGLWIPTSKLP